MTDKPSMATRAWIWEAYGDVYVPEPTATDVECVVCGSPVDCPCVQKGERVGFFHEQRLIDVGLKERKWPYRPWRWMNGRKRKRRKLHRGRYAYLTTKQKRHKAKHELDRAV